MHRYAIMVFAAATLFSGCRERRAVTSANTYSGTFFEISDSLSGLSAPDTLRLGRMREGEIVTREFALRNAGDKPFVVTDISTSCGCLTFEFNREPAAPGQDKMVTVRMDSRGYYGEIVKKASVHTSFSGKPHTIYVEADVH